MARNHEACRVGDRFELQFNFAAQQATAFYNDRRLGLIDDALPRTLYPALTLEHAGDSVEITKFKVIYK